MNNLDKILNERISRSVEVEDVLYKIAAGQIEVPDAAGFRVLAIRLGTPKKQWSDDVKNYQFKVVRHD